MKDRKHLAAIGAGFALFVLIGCTPHTSDVWNGSKHSKVTGTVTGRTPAKTPWLIVKTDHGPVKVFVRRSADRACHKGDQYPRCAS
jgi:hypothetical protein